MYCRIHLPNVSDVFRRFSLSLPTAMLMKDHLVNQEKDKMEYFLISPLRPQVNRLLFSLTGISINILGIAYANT